MGMFTECVHCEEKEKQLTMLRAEHAVLGQQWNDLHQLFLNKIVELKQREEECAALRQELSEVHRELQSNHGILLKAVEKMSHRRCFYCNHEDYYLSASLQNRRCTECGSADTKLIRS